MSIEIDILTPEQIVALATAFFDHESGTRGVAVAQIDGESFTVPISTKDGRLTPGRVVGRFSAPNGQNPVDALERILNPLGFNRRLVT